MITNFDNEALKVPKATVLGTAEEISENIMDKINKKGQSNFDVPTVPQLRRIRRFFRSC